MSRGRRAAGPPPRCAVPYLLLNDGVEQVRPDARDESLPGQLEQPGAQRRANALPMRMISSHLMASSSSRLASLRVGIVVLVPPPR